jgi:hypothetical protein
VQWPYPRPKSSARGDLRTQKLSLSLAHPAARTDPRSGDPPRTCGGSVHEYLAWAVAVDVGVDAFVGMVS